MAKQCLEAGQQFTLSGGAMRVGASGTVVDSVIDWSETSVYCGNNPSEPGSGVGSIVNEGITYDVFFDPYSGKLWFDTEAGY